MKLEHTIKFVSDTCPGADTDLIKKIVHAVFKHLNFSLQNFIKMAEDLKAALDKAEHQANENDSVIDSAIALFSTLSGLIRDTAGSAERANALADKIDAQGAKMATAIAANTPAEGDGTGNTGDTGTDTGNTGGTNQANNPTLG